ncbi:MAG: STAS domain-containing protein [Fibrobacter sp.]|nr:STAS domain-containing protein [Fibrobacter sp.]
MSLKIRSKKINSSPVLEITGEITGENVGKITSKLEGLRKGDSQKVVVDLSKTTFIDSHGLGVFVYIWRLLGEQNRELIFLNPQGFIRNMFNGTNLDKIFKVVDSEEAI